MRTADRRSTTNRDARGGTPARRARKAWLLMTFDQDLGPDACRCTTEGCEVILTMETVSVDRYPIPGCEGGTYVHANIRPKCLPHNVSEGGALGSQRLRSKSV